MAAALHRQENICDGIQHDHIPEIDGAGVCAQLKGLESSAKVISMQDPRETERHKEGVLTSTVAQETTE